MLSSALGRWIPLLVWIISASTIVLIPLAIIGHGYLPADDALRHVAKAYSGKSWAEVLVLADWVKVDHNPGWHTVLGAVHRFGGADPEGLLIFSIVALFSLVFLAPLIWIRRPEVWLAVLGIVGVGITIFLYRTHYGRPLLVSATALMCLLFIWRRNGESGNGRPPWGQFISSALLISAATWIHGGWYLFVLVPFAHALCRQWTAAKWLIGAWIPGTLLGGTLTGRPLTYLSQSVEILFHCFAENVDRKYLAAEFQSSDGSPTVCLIVAMIVVWRFASGAGYKSVYNPAFILTVICWILGLRVIRFWTDCGIPSLLVWMAMQFEDSWNRSVGKDSIERLGLTCALAATAFLSTTGDVRGRWSVANTDDLISASDPATAGWFPGTDGTFYLTSMTQFYRLFYTNPKGEWRYNLGFEPTFMPTDDLSTFRQISRQPSRPESYHPWVKKMRPIDRIVLERTEPIPLPGIKWRLFGQKTWIGRPEAGVVPDAITTPR